MSGAVFGWDIGGVNTKAARLAGGDVLEAQVRLFEIQRHPAGLAPLVAALARDLGARDADAHGLTMTAELSQMFRTKRAGVAFVLDAVGAALPGRLVRVYTADGRFLPPDAARREPLAVAGANWAATARAVAQSHPNAILIDIGSTTTDIIPIVAGRVAARGRTDPERLRAGELVYTGAVRTPAEAMAPLVRLDGGWARVSAEGFALAGDVHLWRGTLGADDYTAPTPDGRPAAREFAGERLARVVCADREMLDDAAVSAIADSLAEAQVATITAAVEAVRQRHPSLACAVVTGVGEFLAVEAARRAGLVAVSLAAAWGSAARHAPAVAVARLLAAELGRGG